MRPGIPFTFTISSLVSIVSYVSSFTPLYKITCFSKVEVGEFWDSCVYVSVFLCARGGDMERLPVSSAEDGWEKIPIL